MPRKSMFPTPKLRWHYGAWQIFWAWDKKQYSVSTGLTDEKKDKKPAEIILHQFALALAKEYPDFPPEYADKAGVIRYVAKRYGATLPSDELLDPTKWLADYEAELRGACSKRWADDSLSMLRKLETSLGGLHKATPSDISKYLSAIASKRSAGTRNHTQNVFSRFYTWAVTTKRLRDNPVKGTKRLKVPRKTDIVYCTPTEREAIIELAKSTGWPEWLAVPIAYFGGMRREEIANLKWPDVNVAAGSVTVIMAKTRVSRTFPLNATLERYLSDTPIASRTGYIVPSLDGASRTWRLNSLVNKMKKIRRAQLLQEWGIIRPAPSKSAEYREARAEYNRQKKARAEELGKELERLGWNAFRHTFGSLLAQNGVSIDKIAAWMGNTPEVCRRHYAQFIPRDRRDNEIDKL